MSTSPPPLDDTRADAGDQLAQRIARQLERHIVSLGWPVGKSLGSEEQLVQHFGANRWAVREALAITERDGLTEMRRGRGGGVFISAPAESVVETTLRNYLLFTSIDIEQLVRIRKAVDSVTYSLAAASCDTARIAAARAVLAELPGAESRVALEQAIDIYDHILGLAGNRFVRIFGLMLAQLTLSLGLYLGNPHFRDEKLTGVARRMVDIRRRQLECVIGADPYGAVQAAGAASDAWLAMFADTPARRQAPRRGEVPARSEAVAQRIAATFGGGRKLKRVDMLTLQIQLDIMRAGLQPGDTIASERELMERYEVGRGVLRDAIRSLQRDGFVRAEEGRGGGLCVAKPRPAAVIRSAALYLHFLKVSSAEITVLAAEILVLAAEFVAQRAQQEAGAAASGIAAPLVQCLGTLRERAEAGDAPALPAGMVSFYQALALAADNPIIELLIGTTLRLTRVVVAPDRGSRQRFSRFSTAVEALAAAFTEGDVQLSRRYLSHICNELTRFELRAGDVDELLNAP